MSGKYCGRGLAICSLAFSISGNPSPAQDVKPTAPTVIGALSEAQQTKLQTDAAEAFGLYSCRLASISRLNIQDELSVRLEFDGIIHHLSLQRNSLRDASFTLRVDDGVLHLVEPPPSRTYTGWLREDPIASVAAAITDDGQLRAMILLDNDTWYIEPVGRKIGGAAIDWHVVYRKGDVKPTNRSCGVDGALSLAERIAKGGNDTPNHTILAGNGLTEIAFDADVEYYQLNGNSVPATVVDIEMIANLVSNIYRGQVDICFTITGIIVRTVEPDPYSTTNSTPLLCQFTQHWNSTNPVGRDVAHLMTGKEIDGSIIGVAWRADGVICAGNFSFSGFCPGVPDGRADYGLSQSRFSSSLANRINLTAHELGHNWGACHCDESSCTGGGADPDCGIMRSFVTGSLTFGTRSRNTITAHRDSISCLGACGGPVADCDGDGISDYVEISVGAPDCNGNGIPDSCDVAGGSADCTGNGIPDTCESLPDCDGSGTADFNDLCNGTGPDCTGDGVLDACQSIPDCDRNDKADFNDLCNGIAQDCNFNAVPDTCDLDPTASNLLLTENFENISLLSGNSWVMLNRSQALGSLSWYQGDSNTFAAYNGPTTSYIAVDNQSAGDGPGPDTISNWLLLPTRTFVDETSLSFYTRGISGSLFPDRLEVRLSVAGASTDVGSSATSVGDFTNPLLTINPSLVQGGYPQAWTLYNVALPNFGGPTMGRLAFRYFVTDGGPVGANSNYIGIDAVQLIGPNTSASADCDNDDTPDECNIGRGESNDCNVNGIPDECESPDCPAELVLFDVNSGGTHSIGGIYSLIGSAGQHGGVGAISGGIYEVLDGFWHGVVSAPPPPNDIIWDPATIPGPWPNNNPLATTRSLRFTVEGEVGPSKPEAIKVTMVDLQHPNPPNLPAQAPPNLTTYDTRLNGVCVGGTLAGHHCDIDADCTSPGTCTGSLAACTADPACADPLKCTLPSNSCARWVGKLGTFYESQGPPVSGPYKAARLQCTPYYWDWKPEGLLTVVGADIAPSSEYSVQVYGASCMGVEAGCLAVSPAVTMYTRRSGDVEQPFNPPSATGQPDVTDVSQLVNKFKNLPGAPVKAIAQLQPNLPELNADINVLDILAVVDALKGTKYAFSGPCACPSLVTCELTGCTSDTPCINAYGAGSKCMKVCTGPGPLAGDLCIDNTHCVGSGTCGTGFCRDRCGRCSP